MEGIPAGPVCSGLPRIPLAVMWQRWKRHCSVSWLRILGLAVEQRHGRQDRRQSPQNGAGRDEHATAGRRRVADLAHTAHERGKAVGLLVPLHP